jgi:RHS repeat-associated protein
MVVNKAGTVKQITHYYPYGGIIGGIDKGPSYQQYKFEGKELDRTYGLDWYDIHARQYDPVVPSWHTVDPLAEKYYWISPYAYCANNPVMYIDEYGDSIFVSYDSQEEVLNMINKISAGTFGVSDNGYLYLVSKTKQEDNNGHYSSYYRDALIEGINASNTAYVSITDKGSVNFYNQEISLNGRGEGATASFENGTAYTYVSGKKYTTSGFSSSPEIVLAHELAGHAIPTIIHPSRLDARYDGNAVTAENIIRSEIGEGLRPMNEYALKDWAVRDMTTSIAKAYYRHLFPKRLF